MNLPPLVRLALIHYQFEAIHPFIDGNGRVGRLLNSLLLAHWDLLPFPLLYLSAYFEQHRPAYYDHLMAVSMNGQWRDWLIFYLNGVVTQAKDAIRKAKQLQDLQLEWRTELASLTRSVTPLRLANTLFETPVITIPQAQATLDVAYNTAKRAIDKLIELAMLHQLDNANYDKIFVATPILRIIINQTSE